MKITGDQIRSDLFLARTEDNQKLSSTGTIYVGTGNIIGISESGTNNIVTGTGATGYIGTYCETTGVAPTKSGLYLKSIGETSGSQSVTGLVFEELTGIISANNVSLKSEKGVTISGGSSGVTISGGSSVIKIYNGGIEITPTSSGAYTIINSLATGTTLYNYQNPVYQAPSGSDQYSPAGTQGCYPPGTGSTVTGLLEIIYNIGKRLDKLEKKITD